MLARSQGPPETSWKLLSVSLGGLQAGMWALGSLAGERLDAFPNGSVYEGGGEHPAEFLSSRLRGNSS